MHERSRSSIWATILALALASGAVWGQTFNSGSTGVDGDLIFPNAQPGQTIIFDPTTLNTPLPANHGNIYNFGVITIPKGVTIRLSGQNLGGPLYWLASGAVDIEGTLDLSGAPGVVANFINQRAPSIPGAGGFPGGVGGNGGNYPAEPGQGPAGGPIVNCGPQHFGIGGPGGFTSNEFLVPLIGGSGGSGQGGGTYGSGGGAGGGAILIASSVSITINGVVTAVGGGAGNASPNNGSGGGAGGAIRLAAPTIQGAGQLNVAGGLTSVCQTGTSDAASGLARLEAFNQLFSGSISGNQASGTPYNTFVPASGSVPTLTVVSVNGVTVASTPLGNFTMPDVTFSASGPVPVMINGTNIPSGTQVNLQFYSENGPDIILPNAGALMGSTASSTVMVMVNNLPPGFSRGFISASFSSQGTAQVSGQAKHK